MSADLHATPPERIEALHAIRDRFKGESTRTQTDRLLEAMRTLGSVSTYEAMRYLDIYDPRPRKHALVQAGYEVLTTRRTTATESGEKHSIGFYSLKRGATAPGEL